MATSSTKYREEWWRGAEQGVDPVLYPIYDDFRLFLFLVWKHLNLPDPTPVQNDIALNLQRGPRRFVIEAFRGVGKSWVTSAFVCWSLMRNPMMNILVVSASKQRADDFTTFTLRLIKEIDMLAFLIPGPEQRQSKVAFDVGPAAASHSASVSSKGITSQLAGGRADLIISDDVEVPNNSMTHAMREKLAESIKEFDAILKPGGRIVYLGTPQTEMSIYNELPNRGYKVRIWPARYPSEALTRAYGDRLAPRVAKALQKDRGLEGRTTDPKRFSDLDLAEREASYGRSGFSLQFMLDTSLADADRYPLKLSDLVIMSLAGDKGPEEVVWSADPRNKLGELGAVGLAGDAYYGPVQVPDSWVPYQGCVMAVDPSGRGGDETSYAVVKVINSQLFLVAAGGIAAGYSQTTLEALSRIAKKHAVGEIVIESNFGDGMFKALWDPVLGGIYPCVTTEVRHNQQKEKRIIDTLEPVLNQHRLIVCRSVVEHDLESVEGLEPEKQAQFKLFYQLTRITSEKGALAHDDRLDAVAMAVAFWVEAMSKDVTKAKEDREMRELMDEIRQIKANTVVGIESVCLGGTPRRVSRRGRVGHRRH